MRRLIAYFISLNSDVDISSAAVVELVPGVSHHLAPPPGLNPHVAVAADHLEPPPVQILKQTDTGTIKHDIKTSKFYLEKRETHVH